MDGDSILNAVGVVLVLAVVGAVAFVGLLIVHPPANPYDEPRANWTLDRVNGTYVRIVHDGGQAVPAEDLVITVDGHPRDFVGSGRLDEGDALLLRARTDSKIVLYWTGGPGRRVFLAGWGPPYRESNVGEARRESRR